MRKVKRRILLGAALGVALAAVCSTMSRRYRAYRRVRAVIDAPEEATDGE